MEQQFLLASNPLQPDSPKYVIDKITNIWFLITKETEGDLLEHVHGGTPEDIKHSKNRAERWYKLVLTK